MEDEIELVDDVESFLLSLQVRAPALILPASPPARRARLPALTCVFLWLRSLVAGGVRGLVRGGWVQGVGGPPLRHRTAARRAGMDQERAYQKAHQAHPETQIR